MRTALVPRGVAAIAVLAALSLAALHGCGDDDSNPVDPGGGGGPSSTQLTGTYINGSEGGLMTVTVSTATLAPALRAGSAANDSVSATATLSPDDGSGVVLLSGQYGTATDSLWLSGSSYTFAGAFDSTGSFDAILGSYEGPNGAGFFGCVVGGTMTLKIYCGTYASGTTTTQGRWNFLITGDEMAGVAFPSGLDPVPLGFEGTVTGVGTLRTLTFEGGESGILLTGTGEWNTTTNVVTGNWAVSGDVTDSGTWSGDLCLPGTTGPNAMAVRR